MKNEVFYSCDFCPHGCGVARDAVNKGFCNTDLKNNIASVCIHKGEEPVISGKNGICNVFFSHCNLQCIYCQNEQISSNDSVAKPIDDSKVLETIKSILDRGIPLLGFVSPSHCIPQMLKIIRKLNADGYHPKIVYNSNGYDSVETLRKIEQYIDIYLPDFKYSDNELAFELSGVKNYVENAINAIKEMFRQKGTLLLKNDEGQAESGLIVRHLVLPGYVDNSLNVLQILVNEFSSGIHISLMAQYFPTENVHDHKNLGRTLFFEEYEKVIDEMERLGFYKGWVQELKSAENYRPDFDLKHPFE